MSFATTTRKYGKLHIISVVILLVLFGLFSSKAVSAATFSISGKVTNSSGDAIVGAILDVIDPSTNTSITNTTTDSAGNYNVVVTEGTYNVQVTPPAGSSFSSAIALAQTISAATTLNFILVPTGSVTLSGHVYDPRGNPATGTIVHIEPSGGGTVVQTTVAADGSYRLPAVPPGTYFLGFDNGTNPTNLPSFFRVFTNSYSLPQSKILNVTLPAKQVDVHIQDSAQLAISGVQLKTDNVVVNGLSIGGDITNATGFSGYGSGTLPVTNQLGNATLWLLPSATAGYAISAEIWSLG